MSEMPTREVWIIKYVCSKGIRRAVLPVDPAGRPKLGYWGMTSGEYTDYEVVARREEDRKPPQATGSVGSHRLYDSAD